MSKVTPKSFRSYILFWAGQLASLLGSTISQYVIVWWIAFETESTFYLSIASLVGFAPNVVLTPFAGVVADKLNRKLLMLVTDFLQATITLILIFLFWQNNPSFLHILGLLALRGGLQAFHRPAFRAVTPTLVPSDKLSRVNGMNYFFSGMINIMGPAVAALLLEAWKISQILWIDIATFIICIVPLIAINIPSVQKKEEKKSFSKDLQESIMFVKKLVGKTALVVISVILVVLIVPFNTLLPYFVLFDHLGGAADLAFVTMVVQSGILAGGVFTSIIKFKKKAITIILLLYGLFAGYAAVTLAPKGIFWIIAAGGFVMVSAASIIIVLAQTIIQMIVPLDMQGRADSVVMTLSFASYPLGMVFSGAIAEYTGVTNIFLACSILGLIIITALWMFTDVKRLEEMIEDENLKVKSEK